MKKYKHWIYAFIALFLWGIHGPAGRYLATSGVNMFFVFSARLWMGAFVFFVFLILRWGICNSPLRFNWFENIRKVIVIALIGLVANTIVFHIALIYLPGTLVMILENLSPIFVFTATVIFYKIRPRVSEILALLIAIFGIIFIVVGKDSFTQLSDGFYIGIVLGILTAITFAGYIFFSADLVRDYQNDPISIIRFLFKIFLVSAVICTPFLLLSKPIPFTKIQWFWLIEMGIMQSGLAYLFWNYALAHIRANTASVLFLLTILFTTINEVIFLGLKLNLYLVLGALMICLAGYFITVSMKR